MCSLYSDQNLSSKLSKWQSHSRRSIFPDFYPCNNDATRSTRILRSLLANHDQMRENCIWHVCFDNGDFHIGIALRVFLGEEKRSRKCTDKLLEGSEHTFTIWDSVLHGNCIWLLWCEVPPFAQNLWNTGRTRLVVFLAFLKELKIN